MTSQEIRKLVSVKAGLKNHQVCLSVLSLYAKAYLTENGEGRAYIEHNNSLEPRLTYSELHIALHRAKKSLYFWENMVGYNEVLIQKNISYNQERINDLIEKLKRAKEERRLEVLNLQNDSIL